VSSPEENEQIARRICEAAWLRPQPDIETIMELGHRDHLMRTVQTIVEGGEGYRGAEGFREWLRSWNEMFGEDWVSTVESAEAMGPENVLITGQMEAQGAHGGVPIAQRFWVAMTVRDGRVISSEVHTGHDRALAAARAGY
jgi:hypothetical protein